MYVFIKFKRKIHKLSDPIQNASAREFQKTWVPKMFKTNLEDMSNGTFRRNGHEL